MPSLIDLTSTLSSSAAFLLTSIGTLLGLINVVLIASRIRSKLAAERAVESRIAERFPAMLLADKNLPSMIKLTVHGDPDGRQVLLLVSSSLSDDNPDPSLIRTAQIKLEDLLAEMDQSSRMFVFEGLHQPSRRGRADYMAKLFDEAAKHNATPIAAPAT